MIVTKVSKFNKQVLAKQQQIENIVKSIIPNVELVAVGTSCHGLNYQGMIVHVFVEGVIIVALHEWDDTIDNRQKIRDSYNEYLASQ